ARLPGLFTATAPAATAALGALTRGEVKAFHDILAPTVPLSRHMFKAPTRFYKTGVVFMAYLNGLQDHFTLIGGQESARSTLHLAEPFRLLDAAGPLPDPDRAAARTCHVRAPGGARAPPRGSGADAQGSATRAARSVQRPRSARTASCLWSAACPKIRAISPARACKCARRCMRSFLTRVKRACRLGSSRCIPC